MIGIAPTRDMPLESHLQETLDWNRTYKRDAIGIAPAMGVSVSNLLYTLCCQPMANQPNVLQQTEAATMIATAMTIKTKATAAVAAASQQRGGQRGGIAAAAAALLQRSSSSKVVQRWWPKDVVGLLLGNSKNTIF